MVDSRGNSRGNIDFLKEESRRERSDNSHLPSRCRRTLLKGAAAIPVIMTLPNGAAAAMSSSQACAARDQQFAVNTQPAWITGSKDTWVRKAVTARTIQMDGFSDDPFVVYQPDLSVDDWLDQQGRHYFTQSSQQLGSTLVENSSVGSNSIANSQMKDSPIEDSSLRSSSITIRNSPLEHHSIESSLGEDNFIGNHSLRSSSITLESNPTENNSIESTLMVDSLNPLGNSLASVAENNPLGGSQMKDGAGNTYSIVQGDSTQYIIAQVDEQGRVVGFGFASEFNHITGSCWTSINPLTGML